MLTTEIADGLDELLGSVTNHLMVWGSTEWEEAYVDYLDRLKAFIDKKYTTELCENANLELTVNQTIWRKIEWVTMKHRARQEQPFPLLTKSLLPRLADALSQVQNAIAESSRLCWSHNTRKYQSHETSMPSHITTYLSESSHNDHPPILTVEYAEQSYYYLILLSRNGHIPPIHYHMITYHNDHPPMLTVQYAERSYYYRMSTNYNDCTPMLTMQ
ncbi:hypothetical protein F5887DRAFT_931046 [Amanita rubescens]|nr:hypothetical protein F5887DRAFT_931046 [Amanita rubescens]